MVLEKRARGAPRCAGGVNVKRSGGDGPQEQPRRRRGGVTGLL